jgi:hypothetical protein
LSFTVPPVPGPQSKGVLSGLVRFLKSHPLLFLLLLTPGIPEYLSASSNLTALVIAPPLFFLFLALNLGLYGSGVILIREAMIRWKKGWASVFLLGAAYGIVEEGIDLWTLFYSKAGPVGNLGYYGHWLGVNWVWTMGLLIFHSVFSIGLPIFLFGLVFPELKSKSLVSGGQLVATILCLFADSAFLFLFVSAIYSGYNPGGGLIIFSLIVITILVVAANKLPNDFLKTTIGPARLSPFKFALLGALLFPTTLLVGGIAAGANAPPIAPFVLDLVLALYILTKAYKSMGTMNNQEQKTTLAIGLLIPIASFGFIASIGIANWLIVAADLLFVAFAQRLWRKWHSWTLLQQHDMHTTLPSFGGSPTPTLPS